MTNEEEEEKQRKMIMIWNWINHCVNEMFDQYEVRILVGYIVIQLLNQTRRFQPLMNTIQ